MAGGLTLTAALAETNRLLAAATEEPTRKLLEGYKNWLLDRIERVTAFRRKRLETQTPNAVPS